MKITVIGTGYVGLTTGTVLAELGHRVACVDKDPRKILTLRDGRVPFYEPGLNDLIKKNLGKNLEFSTDLDSAGESEIIMIAVGTPPAENGSPDLDFVLKAALESVPFLNGYKVIVIKSTVPVGTRRIVEHVLIAGGADRSKFDIVSNPEFLREGIAVWDSFNPDRIVIGSDSQKAAEICRSLYRPIECPVMLTTNEAAEMIKYAANVFLATKISFINELAGICEAYGVDVKEVARGIGYDKRIGHHFLRAGAGFGGSCLPKDLSGLLSMARKAGKKALLLQAVQEVNAGLPELIVKKTEDLLGSLSNKKIAIWGLSFKPETDDMRFAPSLPVIRLLLQKKAVLTAYDPIAMDNAKTVIPDSVSMTSTMYEAAKGCEALILMTEWDIFSKVNLKRLKKEMKKPVFIDGRNAFSPLELEKAGFLFTGMGTSSMTTMEAGFLRR